MLVSNEPREVILKLAAQVRDEDKALAERRAALQHICELRSEPYQAVPEQDLSAVVSAMTAWPKGMKGLSCDAAAEAVREGRMRRDSNRQRR